MVIMFGEIDLINDLTEKKFGKLVYNPIAM